eukprot:COSAG01_NODE_692_length_14213_cov_3.971518_4_plen_432_part_00
MPASARRQVFLAGDGSRLAGGKSGHAAANLREKALLVGGKTFEALQQDLQERAVLKSASKLREAIQHLCFYETDPALMQTMVNLIVHGNISAADKEGRAVLRLAHYFVSSLPPPTALAPMHVKVVGKQLGDKHVGRRVQALRTLSVKAADPDVRTDLQHLVREVLVGIGNPNSNARNRKDAVEHACMQYACMAAIRQRPAQLLLDHNYLPASSMRAAQRGGRETQLERNVLEGVLYATGCLDSVGARHAVALLQEAAQQDAVAVAQFVESNEGDINLFDPLAKVYFIRLCDQLARHPLLSPEQREGFLQRLMRRLASPTAREFLEATKWLLLHHRAQLNAPQQQAITGRFEALLDCAGRLELPLPTFHAVCRVVKGVARALVTIPPGRDRQVRGLPVVDTRSGGGGREFDNQSGAGICGWPERTVAVVASR